MPIVRVALMQPSRGREDEVQQLQERILEIDAAQPGFILGFLFAADRGQGQTGRVIVWEREEDSHHTAMATGIQALRSDLHRVIEPGHTEELYRVVGDIRRPQKD